MTIGRPLHAESPSCCLQHPPRKYFTWKPLKKAADPGSGPAAAQNKPGWRTPGLYRPGTSRSCSSTTEAEGEPTGQHQSQDAAGPAGKQAGIPHPTGQPTAAASAGRKPNSYGSSTLQSALTGTTSTSAAGGSLGSTLVKAGRPSTAEPVRPHPGGSANGGSGLVSSSRNMLEAMRASYGVLFSPPGIYDDESDTEEPTGKVAGQAQGSEAEQPAAAPVRTEGERRRWARRLAAEQQLSGKWGEKDFTWGGALRKKNTHLAVMAPAGTKAIQRSGPPGGSSRPMLQPDERPQPPPDCLQTGPWAGEKWNSCRSSTAGMRRSCMGSTGSPSTSMGGRSSVAGGGGGARSSVAGGRAALPAVASTGAIGVGTTARMAPGALSGPLTSSGGSTSRLSHRRSGGTGLDTEASSDWKRELPFTAALLSGRAWKMGEAFAAARPATAAPGAAAAMSLGVTSYKHRADQQLKMRQQGWDQDDGGCYDAAIATGAAPTLRLRACTAR
jgi:hypothetical protein